MKLWPWKRSPAQTTKPYLVVLTAPGPIDVECHVLSCTISTDNPDGWAYAEPPPVGSYVRLTHHLESLAFPLDGWLRDLQLLEDGSIFLEMDVRDADLEMAMALGLECDDER